MKISYHNVIVGLPVRVAEPCQVLGCRCLGLVLWYSTAFRVVNCCCVSIVRVTFWKTILLACDNTRNLPVCVLPRCVKRWMGVNLTPRFESVFRFFFIVVRLASSCCLVECTIHYPLGI